MNLKKKENLSARRRLVATFMLASYICVLSPVTAFAGTSSPAAV
jgi:hypothetical protein